MAYIADIPQSGDKLKNSQPQILGNFEAIDDLINVNHVGFDTANEGKHKFIQMPRQVAAPTTDATDVALYSAVGEYVTDSQMVYRRQNDGIAIPFTESLLGDANGWSLLPGNLLIKWASADFVASPASGGFAATFTWPLGGTNRPFTSAPYLVNFSISYLSAVSVVSPINLVFSMNRQLTTAGSIFLSCTNPDSNSYPAFRLHIYAIGLGVNA